MKWILSQQDDTCVANFSSQFSKFSFPSKVNLHNASGDTETSFFPFEVMSHNLDDVVKFNVDKLSAIFIDEI